MRDDGAGERVDTKFQGEKEQMQYTAPVAIVVGVVLGLSVGFLDVAIGILLRPSQSLSFSFVLVSLVVTVTVFFLVYEVLWFLIASHLGSFLKLSSIPLAFSLAILVGALFTLAALDNLIDFSLSKNDLLKLSMLFSLSILISIFAYFSAKAVAQTPNYRNIAAVFGLAIPFVLAETAFFVWLFRYKLGSSLSNASFSAFGCYILVALFTIGLLYHVGPKIKILRVLAAFGALVILSPAVIGLVLTNESNASFKGFKESDHDKKYIILITVDTLRPDFLSSYEPKSPHTPNIDQLARDGLLFTKAVSPAPWTLPSIASIMTGLSPSVHMATTRSSKLQDELTTLAEYMLNAGYFTGGIGSNPFLGPQYGTSQGFLEYNFFPKKKTDYSLGSVILHRAFPERFQSEASTSDVTKLAIRWLESNHQRNFFLWIHYLDPHSPYSPPTDFLPEGEPPPGLGTGVGVGKNMKLVRSPAQLEWVKSLYRGEVRFVDENIGKILDSLKLLNIYDESLIILTSDHGEEFWEHGSLEHGHSLYNEVLRVPLIIKLPESSSKGQIGTPVSTQSITPTILNLCGIARDNEYISVGSLSPLGGSNREAFNVQPVISTGLLYYEDRVSVIFDGLKYIRSLLTNREELYDLTRDPKEQTSIANVSPEKTRKMREILGQHDKEAKKLREHYRIDEVKGIKLNRERKQRLKSLGYMQ